MTLLSERGESNKINANKVSYDASYPLLERLDFSFITFSIFVTLLCFDRNSSTLFHRIPRLDTTVKKLAQMITTF